MAKYIIEIFRNLFHFELNVLYFCCPEVESAGQLTRLHDFCHPGLSLICSAPFLLINRSGSDFGPIYQLFLLLTARLNNLPSFYFLKISYSTTFNIVNSWRVQQVYVDLISCSWSLEAPSSQSASSSSCSASELSSVWFGSCLIRRWSGTWAGLACLGGDS